MKKVDKKKNNVFIWNTLLEESLTHIVDHEKEK